MPQLYEHLNPWLNSLLLGCGRGHVALTFDLQTFPISATVLLAFAM